MSDGKRSGVNCTRLNRAPMERALARVRAGEEDPPCRSCGGILKAATISFGQSLVAEDLGMTVAQAAWAASWWPWRGNCWATSLTWRPFP